MVSQQPWVYLAQQALQADEAYCIGPPPSAESYVSFHAISNNLHPTRLYVARNG